MAVLRRIIQLAIAMPVALVSALFVLLKILFVVLKHGPKKAFRGKLRYQPPQCLQNPDLGAHGYVYLEEVRLHYVGTGSERKPLMLLVHGFPEFWYSWRYQLKEFKDNYRVVAIDQRGYGDSDSPPTVSSYDISKLALDIKNLVAALGYQKCVLVGHDWGGIVGWRVAQAHPEVVDKLVILNSPSAMAYRTLTQGRGAFSQLRKSWYIFFFQLPWLPELYLRLHDFKSLEDMFLSDYFGVRSGKMTPEDVEAYKYMFGRSGVSAPINYYRQLLRAGHQKIAFSKVSAQTLIIWGDQDKALDSRLAKLSSELTVEGGATVRLIEGASHWVQMDQPELVNKIMRDFLSQKPNGL